MSQELERGFEEITEQSSEPIDFQADTDEVLANKINARIADAKPIRLRKKEEYDKADAYLDGEPSRKDGAKKDSIINHLFPIIRNMTGLVTDSRPHPGVKITNLKKGIPRDTISELLETGDNLEKDLNNWWDDNKMQSKFQRIVFAQQTYADFFVMPFWDARRNDVWVELLHARRVAIDPNASEVDDSDYAVVDFFKSRSYMYKEFGKEKCKDITFMDYEEAKIYDNEAGDAGQYKLMKNVCKLELYMEPEWWVYKCGKTILKKIRNPFWAVDEETQRTDLENRIKEKHKMGFMGKTVDALKGMVGMETAESKMMEEVEAAMAVFKPRANYFKWPRIPLVHFDTYRMAGELYSRNIINQAIRTIDNINARQEAISLNAENLGKPVVFVDGSVMSDEDAAKLVPASVSKRVRVVRIKTDGQKGIQGSVQVVQGTPVPAQFFDDMIHSERGLDNLFGHHEVSKGAADPRNKTKGGILALQEADQTPIRYLTRNIEDALQELFQWVVQIRKIYMTEEKLIEAGDEARFINYDAINDSFSVFIKSGSMMPVSREQQRSDAMDMFQSGAIDPLTLHERLDDADPEKTAKRLEAWVRERTIVDDNMNSAQQAVVEKVVLIKQNRFEEVQMLPTDDPTVHHDMLLMLLKSNTLTPEQEQFTAELIQKYIQMTQNPMQGGGMTPGESPENPVGDEMV